MPWVADYTARIDPAAMPADLVGACRYLSNNAWKVVGPGEYRELLSSGRHVLLNWEDSADDWLGGASAGRAHATTAARMARALGYPDGSPIAGSADFDMNRGQWDAAGRGYAIAYRDTLHAARFSAGVYGPADVLTWCRGLGGFDVFWQAGMSTAWSGGRNAAAWSGAHLRQRRHATVGGHDVDWNDILRDDWHGGNDVSAETDKDMTYLAPRAEALVHMLPKIRYGPEQGTPVQLVQAVQAINAGLADVKAAVGKVAGGGAPTQEQVTAAVAQTMNDASWLAALGSELAKHIKVS